MDDTRNLPLKRVEISLNNFNDIAIPHHVDLLRKHKVNILKFRECGDVERSRREQINATRAVVQLRNLLAEMEALRQRVRCSDLPHFDRLTLNSRTLTQQAIQQYQALDMPPLLDKQQQSSSSVSSGYSSNSQGALQDKDNSPFVFSQESEHRQMMSSVSSEEQLSLQHSRQQESCLQSWETLQDEVQDLQDIFIKFQQVIHSQKENVTKIEQNTETSSLNVEQATSTLARAERLSCAWYPLAGAMIGGCLAGPIGLVAGIKLGSLALISGTALGFTGGRILKKKKQDGAVDHTAAPQHNQKED